MGDLVVSSVSWNGEAKRRAERPRGGEKSECRDTSEDVGEPTRGTLPSKGRHRSKELLEGKMTEMQSSEKVFTKLERVAKLAKEAPDMAFTSLSHHMDLDWMIEAHRRTRKDGAAGVDGQSAEEYEAGEGGGAAAKDSAASRPARVRPTRDSWRPATRPDAGCSRAAPAT